MTSVSVEELELDHGAEDTTVLCDEVAELVEYLVVSLVDNEDAVEIELIDSVEEDGRLLLEVHVAQEDIGKVIGRKGRIIKALRTLAHAAGVHRDLICEVEVIG